MLYKCFIVFYKCVLSVLVISVLLCVISVISRYKCFISVL